MEARPDTRDDIALSERCRVLWDEPRLYEYCQTRYAEVHELIGKTRETARALLTVQTAVLLAVLAVETKAGIFGPERQDFLVFALAAVSALGLGFGATSAARVAFWAEDAECPPSPAVLVERFIEPDRGVVAVEVSKSLAQAYEKTKVFLDRLHCRLRVSIISSAVGIAGFIVLFLIVAAVYPNLYHQVFGGAPTPLPPATRPADAAIPSLSVPQPR